MRLVDKPIFRPMLCAAKPFIGQAHPTARWVDTGAEMPGWDNHVYLSDIAVQEAMACLGYATPQEVDALRAQITEHEDTILTLMEQIEAAEAKLNAIGALEASGLRVSVA